MLVPTLAKGDIVILDNLGNHEVAPLDALSAMPAPT